MNQNKHLIVFSTCPDQAAADTVAGALVADGLAACVTRIPGARSTYRWQGRIEDATEVLLIVKTSRDRLGTLCARIEQLHPYEVPEIVALEIAGGSERYLDWLGQTLRQDAPAPRPDTPQDP